MSSDKAELNYLTKTAVCLFFCALSMLFWSDHSNAQVPTGPGEAAAAAEAFLDAQGRDGGETGVELSPVDEADGEDEEGIGPSDSRRTADQVSRLEEDYSQRAVSDLRLYGYNIFGGALSPKSVATGRIPDNYVLGIGDELIFTFHGSTKRTVITRVDREGRVILPELLPMQAAGRTYSDFRQELEQRTAAALLGTQVFLSLGSVRMMSILMLGEVQNPGLHRMTSLATVIEALAVAGGIKKTGSMRAIRVRRGNQDVQFDFYNIFLGNGDERMELQDGDSIIVPVIGATVAVDGEVKRPAIYELAKGQTTANIQDLVELAGGTLRPKGYAYLRTTFDDTGRQNVLDVPNGEGEATDGDIIAVRLQEDIQLGTVVLAGHVRVEGRRSLQAAPSVSKLIRDISSLRPSPYLPFAVVSTTNSVTRARIFESINIEHVLNGTADRELNQGDLVIVMSARDVEFLSSRSVRQVILNGVATEGMCSSLRRLARFISDSNLDRYSTAIRSFVVESEEQFEEDQPCPDIFEEYGDLLPFVLEYVIGVHGAIRRPGVFPVTEDTSLASLIAVTGGLSNNADHTSVELLEYRQLPERGISTIERKILDLTVQSPENITISPGSGVRFNALVNDQERSPVQLSGEFVRPGAYTIRRGETLLEIIDRAGGLTQQAYPYGAVFTRESVRDAQQDGFRRAAKEINDGLAAAALTGDVEGAALKVAQEIATELNQVAALGRIVIEADPVVLRARPELNSILEPGDRLVIPKRPNFVTVIGDVLNPASLQFFPGKSVDQYVSETGGPLRSALKKATFVVYPNGEASPVKARFWRTASITIPPGSTIVIPKNVKPLDVLGLTGELTQILSQLAFSAASIAIINRR